MVGGFLIGAAMVTLWLLIPLATGYVHWVRVPENGAAVTVISLIAFLVLACREELAFHGYPLRRLEQTFGVWSAQLIVALVFALEHMVGGWSWTRALFGAGVGSLLFGMAAIATRGLAVPIGLHAAWNFVQSLMGLNGEPTLWRAVVDQGQEQHIEHVRTASYLVVMGSATFAFWLWHCKTNRSPLPD
jgi:membrane protease YdiL (CAAX protease family)